MNKLKIIFKHEFKQITRGKLFLVMTLLGPILFGALMVIPSYFAVKSFKTEANACIAVLSDNAEIVTALSNSFTKKDLILVEVDNIDSGKNLVIDEKCKGFVNIPTDLKSAKYFNYYSTTGTDVQYSEEVENSLREYIFNLKKNELGLSIKESNWLSEEINAKSLKLSDDGSTNDSNYTTVYIISIGLSALIMMTVLIYGISTARSILSEKSSKTVEILLSSVEPYKILLGKALGAGAAGILQFSAWMLMAGIAAKFVIPLLDFDFDLSIITPINIVIIFIYFFLGFFFYIFIYGALGANVENEQKLGQLQLPLQLFLMMPVMISNTIISTPNGMFTKVLSYIPFTSPTVMTARILVDSPGLLRIGLSISILIISLILILLGSAKLFKIGILTKGNKTNIIQIIGHLFKP